MVFTPNLPAPTEADGSILSTAAEYVRDKWQQFLGLSSKVIDLQHRAALQVHRYRAEGKYEEELAAKRLIEELAYLQQLHHKIVERYSGLADHFGLGAVAVPVVLATAFSAAAIAMVWYFRKLDIQEQALGLLESGQLTEAGFLKMNEQAGPSPIRDTLNVAKLALWGFLGWLALQALQGYKSNPPLVIFGNPPEELSNDVISLAYVHAEDGQAYIHEFEGDVEAMPLPDGSLRISHPTKPVWRDFS